MTVLGEHKFMNKLKLFFSFWKAGSDRSAHDSNVRLDFTPNPAQRTLNRLCGAIRNRRMWRYVDTAPFGCWLDCDSNDISRSLNFAGGMRVFSYLWQAFMKCDTTCLWKKKFFFSFELIWIWDGKVSLGRFSTIDFHKIFSQRIFTDIFKNTNYEVNSIEAEFQEFPLFSPHFAPFWGKFSWKMCFPPKYISGTRA